MQWKNPALSALVLLLGGFCALAGEFILRGDHSITPFKGVHPLPWIPSKPIGCAVLRVPQEAHLLIPTGHPKFHTTLTRALEMNLHDPCNFLSQQVSSQGGHQCMLPDNMSGTESCEVTARYSRTNNAAHPCLTCHTSFCSNGVPRPGRFGSEHDALHGVCAVAGQRRLAQQLSHRQRGRGRQAGAHASDCRNCPSCGPSPWYRSRRADAERTDCWAADASRPTD